MYKVEKKKISDLVPYVNNAKKHSQEQIDYLAASIAEFGFTSPIVVDEKNIIIAGHGRLIAAKRLDYSEVPCVVVTGLSEAQKKALRIADNRIAEFAEWDAELLKLEIDFLNEENFEFEKFFDEFGDILGAIENSVSGWNPEKTFDTEVGDGINELVGYGLQSFWKDIKNENTETFQYQIDLPVQENQNLVRQKYSRTNLEEIERVVKTYMREGDFFLESCCGWSTFSSCAKYYGYSGVAIDIWDKALQHSKMQLLKMPGKGSVEVKYMDALNLEFDREFDFIYCNPPFMDQEKYSGKNNDIADSDLEKFKEKIKKLMHEHYKVLKPDGLCVITINDMRKNGYLISLQHHFIECSMSVGFKLWDFVVAEVLSQKIRLRKKDYEKRRTVKCHEYVIVFKKPA